MFMGPCGLISIDEGHRPAWVRASFDRSEINAEKPSDDEVMQMIKLIHDGHARVLPNVGHMHVSTKVTPSLMGDDDESGDEGGECGEKEEEPMKKDSSDEEGESARKKAKQ